MSLIERGFGWLSKQQVTRYRLMLALTLLVTAFMLVGAQDIYLETDFRKFLPPDNPAIMLQDRVADTFSGQDTIFLLVRLDPDSTSSNAVDDIRDPRVIRYLDGLDDEIREDTSVDSVFSPANMFDGRIPEDLGGVVDKIEDKGGRGLFNRDFSATTLMVSSNVGTGNARIDSITESIEEAIANTPKPPGIRVDITGMPSLRSLIAGVLIGDAQYTILLSSAIILVLLVIISFSLIRGYLVFNPLIFALIWTLGTMGWTGLPLSMVTAGVGAMILGLGVEYSVFLVSRYEEERDRGADQQESVKAALVEVGTPILGSSTTTMIGFLALRLSAMPMLRDLGTTLALGIFYAVVASLLVNPSFIVFEENMLKRMVRRLVCDEEAKG